MYPQNSEIEITGNSNNAWGIPLPVLTGAFGCSAPMVAHVGLRLPLRPLVLTTSTMARKGKTGRITALQALNDYGGRMLAFFYVSLATH